MVAHEIAECSQATKKDGPDHRIVLFRIRSLSVLSCERHLILLMHEVKVAGRFRGTACPAGRGTRGRYSGVLDLGGR
jgi:hypothetical protein